GRKEEQVAKEATTPEAQQVGDEKGAPVAPKIEDEFIEDEVNTEAAHLVQLLLGGVPVSERPVLDELPVVRRDIESFQRQHAHHAQLGQPMPCLGSASGPALPVDLTSLIGEFYRPDLFSRSELDLLSPRLKRLLVAIAERSGLIYEERRPPDAFSLFRS